MPKLPVVTSRQTIHALQRAGFVFIRQKGSHCIYRKDIRLITIPYHNRDLKPKTLKSIIKQAGLEVGSLLNYYNLCHAKPFQL